MANRHGRDDQAAGSANAFNLAGMTLGKYRLVEKIGQGGMAQVYRAYQPDLDRYVAIKVLHPHLTDDENFAARFRREARAVAGLEHPNIVRVYDFDADGELAFLVMEHLEGRTLKALLRDLECRDERMDLQEVGRIVGVLAEALNHAHRQGLVHRDVKPANVLITAGDRPVLTDFGIARMVEGATAITESSGALGTPAYMSPEQGQGESGDARSDIYALGVLLYQLCTGQIPFDADTPYAVILKHITAPLPSPRSINPDLAEAVERVILKALAKSPDDRYQTAGEMGRALRSALEPSYVAQSSARSHSAFQRVTEAVAGQLRKTFAFSGRSAAFRVGVLVVVTVLACLLLLLATRPYRIRRFLARLTPTPTATAAPTPTLAPSAAPAPTDTPVPVAAPAALTLAGPELTDDTWLNPDLPDDVWHDLDLVHLQGPLTPDRILLRFDLSDLPEDAKVLSATLALKVELWGEESFPGAAVAYRVLTGWQAEEATYNKPWSVPGLAAGVDYDSVPLDLIPVPDEGRLTFDVSEALEAWRERGEPNHGILVMMSEDSHNWAHHWVYLSEQPAPADRPTLRVAYEVVP